MTRLIFLINYYLLIDRLQIFVRLLLTNYQLISKTQLSKMVQLGGYLGGLLGPLLKTGLPLIKKYN